MVLWSRCERQQYIKGKGKKAKGKEKRMRCGERGAAGSEEKREHDAGGTEDVPQRQERASQTRKAENSKGGGSVSCLRPRHS
jgi:hypothetical protein